jgi:hypothetical protein
VRPIISLTVQHQAVAKSEIGRLEGIIHMKALFAAVIGLLASFYAQSSCEAASVAELKAIVEGVYILDEWHKDGVIFRPPQVDARTVIVNGNIVFLTVNKMDAANQVTNASFGVYTLQEESFAYRYENRSVFSETSSNISVNHAPPWEGMRNFSAMKEGDIVRFQSRTPGQAEFVFGSDGLTYYEGGKLLRKYHRAKSE